MAKALTRLPDWRARFCSFQIGCAARPFARGEHDCALYLARGAEALTGAGFADLFGEYRDLRGAVRVLREFGAGDLEATVASFAPRIGEGEEPRIGDAAIIMRPGGKITGFFTGNAISVVGPSGLVFLGRDEAIAGYRVG